MTLRAAPDGAALPICAGPQNVRTRTVRRRASTRLIRSDRQKSLRSGRPSANLPACHCDRDRRDGPAVASPVLLVLRICAGGSTWAGRFPRPLIWRRHRPSPSRSHVRTYHLRIPSASAPRWSRRGSSARFARSYNGAPSQELLAIRRHKTVERMQEPLFRALFVGARTRKAAP